MTRSKKKKGSVSSKLILVSIGALGIGYYLLNHVATWEEEERVLNEVFYIISGCIFIAAGGILLSMLIKRKFFSKNRTRSRRSKHVFLDKSELKKNQENK
jgi:hypothetical protein